MRGGRGPAGYAWAVLGYLMGTLVGATAAMLVGFAMMLAFRRMGGGMLFPMMAVSAVLPYLGACLGCGFVLRIAGHDHAWETAAAAAVLLAAFAAGAGAMGSATRPAPLVAVGLVLVFAFVVPVVARLSVQLLSGRQPRQEA